MTELEVAHLMARGLVDSPAKIGSVTLVKMRVTGTGMAYRAGLKEYVWRDPAEFATAEFAERCNGLPVVVDHTKNEEELSERVIGTLVYPYLDGDEVWAIARIFLEEDLALMDTTHTSTSPAVSFLDPAEIDVTKLESGEVIRIEGKPTIVDHLAIVPLGVWDKGQDPHGIVME